MLHLSDFDSRIRNIVNDGYNVIIVAPVNSQTAAMSYVCSNFKRSPTKMSWIGHRDYESIFVELSQARSLDRHAILLNDASDKALKLLNDVACFAIKGIFVVSDIKSKCIPRRLVDDAGLIVDWETGAEIEDVDEDFDRQYVARMLSHKNKEEKKPMKEEKKPMTNESTAIAKPSKTTQLAKRAFEEGKKNMKDGAWLAAARQTVLLFKDPSLAAIEKYFGPLPAGIATQLVKTDIGEGVFAIALGTAMSGISQALPSSIGESPKLERLAEEIRKYGCFKATSFITDLVTGPLRDMLVELITNLPEVPAGELPTEK